MKRRPSERRPVLKLELQGQGHDNMPRLLGNDNHLKGMLEQYESDNDDESTDKQLVERNVMDFYNEIKETSAADVSKNVWLACYDEASGYPYYWNQNTNQVTWEMPVEYEVSHVTETPSQKSEPSTEKHSKYSDKTRNVTEKLRSRTKFKNARIKRPTSDSEDEKIVMITSFCEEESSEEDQLVKNKSKHNLLSSILNTRERHIKTLDSDLSVCQKEVCSLEQPCKSDITDGLLCKDLSKFSKSAISLHSPSKTFEFHSDANTDTEMVRDTVENSNGMMIEPTEGESLTLVQTLQNRATILRDGASTVHAKSDNMDVDDLIAQIEMEQPCDMSARASGFSLVAGYGGDSDEEEPKPSTVNTLFPIALETSLTPHINNFDNTAETEIDTNSVPLTLPLKCIQIDGIGLENALKDDTQSKLEVIEKTDSIVQNKYCLKQDVEQGITKTIKRKRRIALDILPSKLQVEITNVNSSSIKQPYTESRSPTKAGFGFNNEDCQELLQKDSTLYSNFKKGGVFVQSKSQELNNHSEKGTVDDGNITELIQLIESKVTFLGEGKHPVSPVQVIAIQLQTLLTAKKYGGLTSTYLNDWLHQTAADLLKLEQEVAPTEWECHWDRENNRYFYKNIVTGESQWDYPETRGSTDMDISMTPPHIDHEEDKSELATAKRITRTAKREKTRSRSISPKTPPPPNIGSDMKSAKISMKVSLPEKSIPAIGILPPLPSTTPPSTPPPPPSLPPPPPYPPPPQSPQPPSPSPTPRSHNLDATLISTGDQPPPPGIDLVEVPPFMMSSVPKSPPIAVKPAHSAELTYSKMHDVTGVMVTSEQSAMMQYGYMHSHSMIHSNILQHQMSLEYAGTPIFQPAAHASQIPVAKQVKNRKLEQIGSELESFYSDIASLEGKILGESAEGKIQAKVSNDVIIDQETVAQRSDSPTEGVKKRKKTSKSKIISNLGLKKRDVSGLVAKWQQVQQNLNDE